MFNFYLVVHSMSPNASEFVTANLPGVSKRQIQRVSSKRRGAPVIHLSDEDMRTSVKNHSKLISTRLKNSTACIAFSVGIGATVIGKAFQ